MLSAARGALALITHKQFINQLIFFIPIECWPTSPHSMEEEGRASHIKEREKDSSCSANNTFNPWNQFVFWFHWNWMLLIAAPGSRSLSLKKFKNFFMERLALPARSNGAPNRPSSTQLFLSCFVDWLSCLAWLVFLWRSPLALLAPITAAGSKKASPTQPSIAASIPFHSPIKFKLKINLIWWEWKESNSPKEINQLHEIKKEKLLFFFYWLNEVLISLALTAAAQAVNSFFFSINFPILKEKVEEKKRVEWPAA